MVSSHTTQWYFLLPFQCLRLTMTEGYGKWLSESSFLRPPQNLQPASYACKARRLPALPTTQPWWPFLHHPPPLCPGTQSSSLFFRHTNLSPPLRLWLQGHFVISGPRPSLTHQPTLLFSRQAFPFSLMTKHRSLKHLLGRFGSCAVPPLTYPATPKSGTFSFTILKAQPGT